MISLGILNYADEDLNQKNNLYPALLSTGLQGKQKLQTGLGAIKGDGWIHLVHHLNICSCDEI